MSAPTGNLAAIVSLDFHDKFNGSLVAFLAGGKYCSLSIRCSCGKWRREKRKGRERNERNCRSVSIESLFPTHAPSPKISSPFTPKAGLILRLKDELENSF